MRHLLTLAACVATLAFVGGVFVAAVAYTHQAQAEMLDRVEAGQP
jgi:hypothetical protein